MRVYTPAEIREFLRVSDEKVFAWIHSGELAAFDVSGKKATRPRYRIEESALRDFIRMKSVNAPPKVTTRRKKKTRPIKRYV